MIQSWIGQACVLIPAKVRNRLRPLTRLYASAGPIAVLRWIFIRLATRLGRPEPLHWFVSPREAEYPLQARLRGSSDMDVYEQIFTDQEYACLRDISEPKLVLDLGANIGCSSAYFLNIFPKARVVAVEPDDGNISVCKTNLAPYGDRAVVVHGAVWPAAGKLQLRKGSYGDGREWATQVEEVTDGADGNVRAWDLESLIALSGSDTVDLLKVDIERAEIAVFNESARSWLYRVRNICIELHGKDCEEVFFAALAPFDYDLSHSGELTICRNLRLRM